MSLAAAFDSAGVLPIRGVAPGFATALFSSSASNYTFIQDIDPDGVTRGFIPIERDEAMRAMWDVPRRPVRAGDAALFAFLAHPPALILGTKPEMEEALRRVFDSLRSTPFVRHQVAKFLGDPALIEDAQAEAQRILRGGQPLPRPRNPCVPSPDEIPITSVDMKAYRLVQARLPPIPILLDTDEIASVLSLLDTNASVRSLLDMDEKAGVRSPKNYVDSTVISAFRHTDPRGGLFNTPGTGAFYLADNLSSARVATGHRLSRIAFEHFVPSEYRLVALEYDAEAALHDIRNFPSFIDMADWTATQEFGQTLRSLHSSAGIIYSSPWTPGSGELCLFSPQPITAGRVAGQYKVMVDAHGEQTWRQVG